ncbi:hypothetical protein PO909_010198 [Leuciscus waleckii]
MRGVPIYDIRNVEFHSLDRELLGLWLFHAWAEHGVVFWWCCYSALLEQVVVKCEGFSVDHLERVYSVLSQCIYQHRRDYDKTHLIEAMERQVEHFRNIPVMNRGLSERNVIGDSFDRRGRGQRSEPSP